MAAEVQEQLDLAVVEL
jgi:hypothetical protein